MKAPDAVRAYFSEVGKIGGAARRDKLTPQRRKEIAAKAGKASGVARQPKEKASAE